MILDLCSHLFESSIDGVADALDKAARVPTSFIDSVRWSEPKE